MSTLRITTPTQQGSRLSWINDLFQQCSNVISKVEAVEAIPVPEVRELTWDDWDEAVIHQDRRDRWSQFPVLVDFERRCTR